MTQITDKMVRTVLRIFREPLTCYAHRENEIQDLAKMRRALTAALGAAPAAEAVTGRDEWQPIETAPRDGTLIDVWCIRPPHEAEERDHEIRLTDISWCDTRWGRITDTGMLDLVEEGACDESGFPPWVPTHWRPLPAPPATIPAPRPVVAEVGGSIEAAEDPAHG